MARRKLGAGKMTPLANENVEWNSSSSSSSFLTEFSRCVCVCVWVCVLFFTLFVSKQGKIGSHPNPWWMEKLVAVAGRWFPSSGKVFNHRARTLSLSYSLARSLSTSQGDGGFGNQIYLNNFLVIIPFNYTASCRMRRVSERVWHKTGASERRLAHLRAAFLFVLVSLKDFACLK